MSRAETGTSSGEAVVSRVETSSPLLSSDPASLFGSAGTIDDALRPALEDALNVELNLEDTFEMTPAGGYTVVFNYLIEGDLAFRSCRSVWGGCRQPRRYCHP